MKLFLQKNAKFSSATVPPAAGGKAPRPPKQPPIANFWLRAWWYDVKISALATFPYFSSLVVVV